MICFPKGFKGFLYFRKGHFCIFGRDKLGQEAPRRHPGGIQEPRELQKASFSLNRHHSQTECKKHTKLMILQCVFEGPFRIHWYLQKNDGKQPSTWRRTLQEPFTNTVRTPTAKDCFGNELVFDPFPMHGKQIQFKMGFGWSHSFLSLSGNCPRERSLLRALKAQCRQRSPTRAKRAKLYQRDPN